MGNWFSLYSMQNEKSEQKKKRHGGSIIRGSELLASSNDYDQTYYHYASDEMGSITYLVDTQKILNQYDYDAWGNVVSQKETISNRFKFNGRQLDPITRQYYLRARFYNLVIGRFTQEDTYRGDGLNLYAYCANNPVYYVDPSGYSKVRQACPDMTSILKEGKNLPEARILHNETISKKDYKKLRDRTPSTKIRDLINMHYEDSIKGKLDVALGSEITVKLETDHIVLMKVITYKENK